ncbi:IS3 family transposase [Rhodocytophaga rosea]|uniref:IS3 family transposase n=1 Tax=Rhodocytophaga rosea TaxID=2704465 RepID=UPI0037423C3B
MGYAVAESFFKTLKTECVYSSSFANQQEARVVIFEYLEVFYNRKRLHSALGYRSTAQMEKLLNQHQNTA